MSRVCKQARHGGKEVMCGDQTGPDGYGAPGGTGPWLSAQEPDGTGLRVVTGLELTNVLEEKEEFQL
jgi:hypothetical protein